MGTVHHTYGGFDFELEFTPALPPILDRWGNVLEEGEPEEVEVVCIRNQAGARVELPYQMEQEAIASFFQWVETLRRFPCENSTN